MVQFNNETMINNHIEIKALNNQDLLSKIKTLASEDRRLQVIFLKHLKEVEKRKLFLQIGYSSLFEYVVKELGYSESTAYRRIEAARLLNEIPEIEEKLKSGVLSLNTAAQVQTFFKKVKKHAESNLPPLKKSELLSQLENKSSRETERHLLSLTPEAHLPKEKIKPLTAEHTELKLILNEDQKQRLDQLKLLLSHVNPNMTYQELIDHLCQRTLKQLDPKLKNNNIKPNLLKIDNAKSTKPNSRYLLSALKVKIHQRDQGCCSYVSPQTGKKCGSKFQVQVDHIQPYALGGKNEESNLRLLCSAHNRLRAEQTFGIR